ncbi:hypothetical protein BSKO_00094 [Bryopsis sp. KO-2023]|nr:hypothetical protein BSKO_00094 [Bryopsis sp. KO-2023]
MAKSVNIGIGLIGPGLIGSTLVNQIAAQVPPLKQKYGLNLQLLGVANSRKMLVNSEGIDLKSWSQAFESQAEAVELGSFFDRFMGVSGCHHVLIDSTANDSIPDHYEKLLSAGCHVITPNKKMGAGPYERYMAAKKAMESSGAHFFYESTVGAGLPVISSLQGLLDTGDKISIIDGVFSGTLSYIFNSLSKDMPFSEVVKSAKLNGFTEPDPREDLAGMDVARKVVVLARECGMKIDLNDLDIESLVPEPLQGVASVDEFMEKLPQFDEQMLQRVKEADDQGSVLRYVGVVDVANQKCEVALKRYPKDHALAGLSGTDNIICISSERYDTLPLIVRGPGAGAAVTATGVFSDLVTLGKQLS